MKPLSCFPDHIQSGSEGSILSRIPSFSVILMVLVLMIVGAGIMPLLNIQYTPSVQAQGLSVSFSWAGASARVVEAEVSSKIEGILASVSGVSHLSSMSVQGGGSVSVQFKKGVNMDAVRFEIASRMRQLYAKLPPGVTYPSISISSSGEQQGPILVYTLNAAIPTDQIERYGEQHIVNELARIKGVSQVALSGAVPYYVEILFDPAKLERNAVTLDELRDGINVGMDQKDIVGTLWQDNTGNEPQQMSIVLSNNTKMDDFEIIPIKNSAGRIVRLGDLAKITYKEQLPSHYFRINGLNTINLSITPEKYVNTIQLAQQIKSRMETLQKNFPDRFSATLDYDASEFIKTELHKIFLRTILSVLILLLFVFAVSRSVRYLIIIAVTLLANILIAFIFYYFLNLEIHLYSLAGITVSLGIIIDTSIIMIDHYGYYRDRKAFIAILAAVLTTVGSLSIVFLLPDHQKMNLSDFAAVMIINLMLSIFIALIFVPALIDTFPIRSRRKTLNRKRAHRLLRFQRAYERYILFGKRHKWAFILIAVLGFGLPVYLLPDKIKTESGKQEPFWAQWYNKTLGNKWYREEIKPIVEKSLGGSLRYFIKNMNDGNYFREPQRTVLSIRAAMPEGCSVQQLNEVVVMMENFLCRFDQIGQFTTRIHNYQDAGIDVTFRPEVEHTGFPLRLKHAVIQRAANFGGATWNVYGVSENSFDNSIHTGYKWQRVILSGYNYDQLYRYAERLVKDLLANKRVVDPGIYGQVGWGNDLSRNEFYLAFNRQQISRNGVDLSELYRMIDTRLHRSEQNVYFDGESLFGVILQSAERDRFDVWRLGNEYISGSNGKIILFSHLGEIAKRRTGNDIYKFDQQYTLTVAYDFMGPPELASKIARTQVDHMNEKVLPLGFKARGESYGGVGGGVGQQYLLLLLVIAMIYFCCAVLFESLLQPLIILSLIPLSFIGLFLTFALIGFNFDQGGFAAMVLLCGMVVNAGIYIMNQYSLTHKVSGGLSVRNYLKAYNHKIIPILLTVISSVLGLLPFLYDGKSEVFWFAFAVGSIGGMFFSLIAMVFYLPLFVPMKGRRTRKYS